MPRACALQQGKPPEREACALQRRPSAAKINKSEKKENTHLPPASRLDDTEEQITTKQNKTNICSKLT